MDLHERAALAAETAEGFEARAEREAQRDPALSAHYWQRAAQAWREYQRLEARASKLARGIKDESEAA